MHRGWLGVLGAAALSCSRGGPVAERAPELDVVVGGCSAWVGEACEREHTRPLRLFVASASEPVLAGPSAWMVRDKQAREDGWLLVLDASGDLGPVEVVAGGRRARVEVRAREATDTPERADALRRRGELETAYALTQVRAGDSALEGARKAAVRARIELARRDLDRSLASLRDTAARYAALGRGAEAADQHFTIAYVQLIDLADSRGAMASVDAGLAAAGRSGRARSLAAYFRGLVRAKVGDVRGALEDLRAARRLANLMGEESLAKDVVQVEVQVLPLLGRSHEARDALGKLLAGRDLSVCGQAMALNNLAWLDVLDELAGGLPSPDTVALLDRAAALFEGDCADARERANVETNRLLLAAQRGAWNEARSRLAALDMLGPLGAEVRAWIDEVDAALALAEGTATQAEAKYRALEELAGQRGHLPLRVLALQGVARSLERQGKLASALAWYRDAERTWRTASRQVPLGEGRAGFLERARRSRRHYLGLLLQLGRTREAFDFARGLRLELMESVRWWDRAAQLDAPERTAWFEALSELRRGQNALDQRSEQDWTLPAEERRLAQESREREREAIARRWEAMLGELGFAEAELPASPREDGSAVILFSHTDVGRVVFVASSEGVVAMQAPRDHLGWLGRVARQIRDAPGVMVLLEPEALALRLDLRLRERLPPGAPVVYSMDLPTSESCRAPSVRKALVVADPGQDLVHARIEGQQVADALAKGGATVELVSGAKARTVQVRARLESPDLDWFHFAGHAVRGGREGRASALLFADGTRLEVDDILTLERAPPRVVLSSCEGAAFDGEAVLGLGVAQAFLLAGACEVVAGTRTVGDAATLALMTQLYAASPSAPLSIRLRQAEPEVRGSTTSLDLVAIQR